MPLTPYSQRRIKRSNRSFSYSKAVPCSKVNFVKIEFPRLGCRSSHAVRLSKRDVSSRLRVMHTEPTALKEDAVELQLTPLKHRPNIRVIRISRQEDSPDHKTTTDSEVYKQYTRTPLNKENTTTQNPSALMNELLLFMKPSSPPIKPAKSRTRVRPLMYSPN